MRLTYKAQDQYGKETGTIWYASRDGDSIFPKSSKEEQVLKKLSAYEDAEDHGLLVRLPCKVGDTVYEIDLPEYGVIVCKVLYVDCYCGPFAHAPGGKIVSATSVGVEVVGGHGKGSSYAFEKDDFGKTVFLSREEAENALRKGGGET